MLDSWFDRLRRGDRRALARLISWAARGEHLDAIQAGLSASRPRFAVAITGSGGVGKSTLVGRLVKELRSLGRTVAVLACDPASPVTGGALLGDRIRMQVDPGDDGLYVRSLAVASGQPSIPAHLDLMVQLASQAGFDVVLIETSGAGQGDTAVRAIADVVVVLLQPETGDELQWQKAGLLEIADVVVVHKADLPGAGHVASELRELLNLPGSRAVPIVEVSSRDGKGLSELWQQIAACKATSPQLGELHREMA